jgi:hypothetical protein
MTIPQTALMDESRAVCVCNPTTWNGPADPICKEFEASWMKAEWCNECGHDAACHAQPTNAVTQRGE